jgi:hypothetical protein
MPRQARLDAPGTLHHVMVRGHERRLIFRGDADRHDFVDRMQRALADRAPRPAARLPLDALIARVCRQLGIPPAHLTAGTRRLAVSRAREGIAYLWTEVLGHAGRPLAPGLGIRRRVAGPESNPDPASWRTELNRPLRTARSG